MADLITAETGQPVELVSGARGEFTVRVGDQVVAKKSFAGFPSEPDAVAAVRQALNG